MKLKTLKNLENKIIFNSSLFTDGTMLIEETQKNYISKILLKQEAINWIKWFAKKNKLKEFPYDVKMTTQGVSLKLNWGEERTDREDEALRLISAFMVFFNIKKEDLK